MRIFGKQNLWSTAAVMMAFALPVWAQAEVPNVADLIKNTPGATGVFEVADNGAVRHIQSRLVCPAEFPNVSFWSLAVFESAKGPGTDVGCDYGRRNQQGQAVTKLSIYAVKMSAGDTVDKAFARYQSEVRRVSPGAIVLGTSLKFEGPPPPELSEVRSEEYELTFNGQRFHSELIIATRNGWIIEVRSTSPLTVPDADEAALASLDLALGFQAVLQAVTSIGGDEAFRK